VEGTEGVESASFGRVDKSFSRSWTEDVGAGDGESGFSRFSRTGEGEGDAEISPSYVGVPLRL